MRNRGWLFILGVVLVLAAAMVTGQSSHPPPSAPEESATIVDDPTVAPDAAQSADKDVTFPTDI
jgi:hypothetical protein